MTILLHMILSYSKLMLAYQMDESIVSIIIPS